MADQDSQTQTVAPPRPPDVPPATGVAAPPPPDDGRRRGVRSGIALIIIGMVLLAAQFLPGVTWWQLWPLIIVAVGVVHVVTPGNEGWSLNRAFDGLVTITIGLLLFGCVTGVIGWRVWAIVLSLWPVLLISIGFDLLGKALKASWLRALGSLLVIAALVYAASVSAAGMTSGWGFVSSADSTTVDISEEALGVERASLRLDAGVATVDLAGGDALIEGSVSSPFGTPQLEVSRTGTSADLTLDLGKGERAVFWPVEAGAEVDAAISRDVLWDIHVETGVASVDADLSDVRVESLVLVPGVTDLSVKLGEAPAEVDESQVEVRAGVSSVRIELPRDAEVRIESASGLTGTDVDSRFERTEGGWESAGYEQARSAGRPTWLVTLKSGVGSVNVETY